MQAVVRAVPRASWIQRRERWHAWVAWGLFALLALALFSQLKPLSPEELRQEDPVYEHIFEPLATKPQLSVREWIARGDGEAYWSNRREHPVVKCFEAPSLHGQLRQPSSKRARFHILQQWFVVNVPLRQREYDLTMQLNLDNPVVKHIHVLLEKESDWDELDRFDDPHRKLIPCLLGARVYYRDFFRYMNKYLAGELVIMNNGDISVGEGFDLIDPEDLTDKIYAPVRWHVPECPNSYIVKAPINPILIEQVEIRFGGIMGGENLFMYEARRAGYNVTNPCLTLKMYHHHCSEIRITSMLNGTRVDTNGRASTSGIRHHLDKRLRNPRD